MLKISTRSTICAFSSFTLRAIRSHVTTNRRCSSHSETISIGPFVKTSNIWPAICSRRKIRRLNVASSLTRKIATSSTVGRRPRPSTISFGQSPSSAPSSSKCITARSTQNCTRMLKLRRNRRKRKRRKKPRKAPSCSPLRRIRPVHSRIHDCSST